MRIVICVLLSALTIACGAPSKDSSSEATGDKLTGTVSIDGSSTVFPITEAVAEEYRNVEPKVRVTVGISGTGGGFKKFCSGEIDISDASRPIKSSEVEKCAAGGVDYVELPVAFDGLSVIVSKENTFIDHLTTDELKQLWELGSAVKTWKDLRSDWPAEEIALFGPGTDSGTFDYFVEAILGKKGEIRNDFSASEDDNVLVQGVAGDPNALGFFGYAYYVENQARLRVVPIDGGDGPVSPTEQTINDGSYQPLSRPIFIYVGVAAADRPEVTSFVDFYIENAPTLVGEVGYVALPTRVYELARQRFTDRVGGSAFHGATVGVTIEDLMSNSGSEQPGSGEG